MNDKARYLAYGVEAANNYLKNNVPLNDTIVKIAQKHKLNPDQIKRVCEFANHAVTASLYKTAGLDAYIHFPLAEAGVVKEALLKTAQNNFDILEEYEKIPGYIGDNISIVDEIKKVAQTEKLNRSTMLKKAAYEIEQVINEGCAKRNELLKVADTAASCSIPKFEQFYKQVVNLLKSGIPFEAIEKSFKRVEGVPEDVDNEIMERLRERLQADSLLDRKPKDTDIVFTDKSEAHTLVNDKLAQVRHLLCERNKAINAAIEINQTVNELVEKLALIKNETDYVHKAPKPPATLKTKKITAKTKNVAGKVGKGATKVMNSHFLSNMVFSGLFTLPEAFAKKTYY
jgi:hypothetical protein